MKLTLLVGPPGSGKTTHAQLMCERDKDLVYINQDAQGGAHLAFFRKAMTEGKSVVVDRLNFNVEQRKRYLDLTIDTQYSTEIVVFHESYSTCLDRVRARVGHETITDEKGARSALNMFFTKYERVQNGEADEVTRRWPDGPKEKALCVDLDGTMCNIDHRLHFVKVEGKKDWKSFFNNLAGDSVNQWCADIVNKFSSTHAIVYCSGRPDDHKRTTTKWLTDNELHFGHLYMRMRGDFREDSIIKEILLEFELKTRFDIYFAIDDRARVVQMWRRHNIVTLACADGEF